MDNMDTIYLLKECDSGSKMAVSSINDVLDNVQSDGLKRLLMESRSHHEKLGNELHSLLTKYNSEEKDPNPMAKGMSWLKTNMKLGMDESDKVIADLMTDGCHMGVKSLHKYQNKYPAANHEAKDICNRLIDIEEQLCKGLVEYL